jgi:hypothetical protein
MSPSLSLHCSFSVSEKLLPTFEALCTETEEAKLPVEAYQRAQMQLDIFVTSSEMKANGSFVQLPLCLWGNSFMYPLDRG